MLYEVITLPQTSFELNGLKNALNAKEARQLVAHLRLIAPQLGAHLRVVEAADPRPLLDEGA